MYSFLKHAHSGWRWIVLILLVAAIANAFMKWQKKSDYKESDRKLSTFAMIATHIQFLFGIVLLFISPLAIKAMKNYESFGELMGNAINRFYTVEHTSMMLLAIALITIGNARTKRLNVAASKHKSVFIFFLLGLLIMLVSIPWPGFRGLPGSWF